MKNSYTLVAAIHETKQSSKLKFDSNHGEYLIIRYDKKTEGGLAFIIENSVKYKTGNLSHHTFLTTTFT